MNKSSDDLSVQMICQSSCVKTTTQMKTILWKYLITNALSRIPKVLRVGFMGQNSHTENVDMFLRVFKEALEVVQGRTKSHLW